jgi:pro-apoptotic serine protease NMA111
LSALSASRPGKRRRRILGGLAAALLVALPAGAAAPGEGADVAGGSPRPQWARTLDSISQGVVAIQIDLNRAFDTETSTTAQATGFVVDARRGLILTNRHVVTSGPVTARAIFVNREEVRLYPVYRDPVHDFGIYRYDPSQLHFIAPREIPLYPAGARVGTEIRVVGNDAGEQLSFLAGTIARLDRQAPAYGIGRYNDFNTFYYQAASSTSGGSSGSPVVDIEGRAVALNAGGATGAASSFYLPLDRVVRALELIRAGKPVPRGTLETVFEYTPFDELKRLGLAAATESEVRRAFPRQLGMLVVGQIQPGSPAAGALEVGDIVIGIDHRPVTEFLALASALDEAVGRRVSVEVERGGARIVRELPVIDLYSITPDQYLEFGDAVLHNLSYQQARHLNVPVSGVYVASPGYVFAAAGIQRGAVLTEFAGQAVRTLDDIERSLGTLADGAIVPVRFITLEDTRAPQVRTIRIDRRWFAARRCRRDDVEGLWPCRDLAEPPAPAAPRAGETTYAADLADPRARRLAPSLVSVSYDMPYFVSGVSERSYHGTGVVLDAARGLVVVDRNTVPVAAGDLRLTFAGTLDVPGRVEYVHPLHNLAIISYDPRLVGSTPVVAARLVPRDLKPGEPAFVVGLRPDQRVVTQEARVAAVDPVQFAPSRTLGFRDSNVEVVTLVNGPAEFDGMIADADGAVTALWSSFAFDNGRELTQANFGVPAELVQDALAHARDGTPLRSLEVELAVVPLAAARRLGLPDSWIAALAAHSPARRQVLSVSRVVAGSPAAGVLQPGDLLLALDGTVVNRFREAERAAQKPVVALTVWRAGAEVKLSLATRELSGRDLDRFVMWAGATLQAPQRALAAQRGIEPGGVYVANFSYGSPSARAGLLAGRRIVAVDGQPTPDLDAFLAAVAGRGGHESVRLKTLNLNNVVEVITLRPDHHYWPTSELRRGAVGWERRAID